MTRRSVNAARTNGPRLTICLAAGCLLAGTTWPVAAGQPAPAPAVVPPLAADAKVTAAIQSLGPGESALLPPIRVAGELNDEARKWKMDKTGPCGRNYCVKMMWMADRQRALFCGANHAVPHRLNDVWEYDLPSNTWVCLYAPDLSKGSNMDGWTDIELVEGILRTKRGGPAIIGHQWWQCTYDPELKAMLFVNTWGTAFPKEIREQYLQSGKHSHQPPLWAFHPAAGKWEPIACKPPAPRSANASYLEYIPDLKRSAWVNTTSGGTGMWLYDSAAKAWKELAGGDPFKPRYNADTPLSDGVMAYCPGKRLLVGCSKAYDKVGGRTVHYDIDKGQWHKTAEGPDVPAGHTSFTPFAYDSLGQVCLLYDQQADTLWAYDVDRKSWSKVTPKGPPAPAGSAGKVIGYYDVARNVFVLSQKTTVWVYRHAKPPASQPAE